MRRLGLLQLPTNYEHYTAEPIRMFSYFGVTMDPNPTLGQKAYTFFGYICALISLAEAIAYIGFECGTLSDRYAVVSPLTYYIMASFKLPLMLHHRPDLIYILDEFKSFSPSIYEIKEYGLENHFRSYKKVERFLYIFFKYIVILIVFQPIIQSFVVLFLVGKFGYLLPLNVWPEIPDENGYIIYGMHYMVLCWSTPFIGFTNVGGDVFLISFLSQLCVHFELIAKRIAELRPEEEKSFEALNDIIKDHQRVLKIAKKVNEIFGASIGLNLMSSSFIMCFVAYQMLDEVSAIDAIKAFLVLCYESKQIVLICHYGEKLTNASLKVFEAIYMQEWNKGSLNYQRHIRFFLMKTRYATSLRIGGVIDVSFFTLRQVFSNAYQIFALLKTK